MIPLWQDGCSLLFADVRGQIDDNESMEGNWGLGLRTIRDNGWIFGGYTFYDLRHTENSNYFDQLTFGLEALSVEWDARVNGYIPETDAPTDDTGAQHDTLSLQRLPRHVGCVHRGERPAEVVEPVAVTSCRVLVVVTARQVDSGLILNPGELNVQRAPVVPPREHVWMVGPQRLDV